MGMSREHLYKAKRMNWRELPKEEWWVEGFYVQLPKFSLGATIVAGGDLCAEDVADHIIVNNRKQHSNFSNAYPLEVVECERYEVDPETICEYTGLNDKSGKRFEGYIFQASDGDYIQRYVIAWNEDSLEWSAECIGNPDGTLPLYEFRVGEIEVIGNIFDNPELLEGGKAE